MAILNQQPKEERLKKLVDDYRDKVLGKTCLKSAPAEYWELGLVAELKISMIDWNQYSLDDKARVMARHYLKGMVETIDAHYREQDEAKERQQRELDKKLGKKS